MKREQDKKSKSVLSETSSTDQKDPKQVPEEWLFVNKSTTKGSESELSYDSQTVASSSQSFSSNYRLRSSLKSASKQKVDPCSILKINNTRKSTEKKTQSSTELEMSGLQNSGDSSSKTSAYDAIEDSLYREIDKDQSTGSGRRVHTGNYRMKEKSEKVTTKDVNETAEAKKPTKDDASGK